MVTFNLYPYREREKKYQQKQFTRFLFLLCVLIFVLLALVHLQSVKQIKQISKQINVLQTKILQHKKQIIPKNLPKIVTKVQPVFLLELLIAINDDFMFNVCFTKIMRTDNVVTLFGSSLSLNDLTRFLFQKKLGRLFSSLEIKSIAQQKNGAMSFVIQGNRR